MFNLTLQPIIAFIRLLPIWKLKNELKRERLKKLDYEAILKKTIYLFSCFTTLELHDRACNIMVVLNDSLM